MNKEIFTAAAVVGDVATTTTMTNPQHADATGEDDPTQIVLRSVRLSAAPYLPPPVLNAIHITDSYLHVNHASFSSTYCHSEPSVSMLSALFSAYVVLRLIQGLQFWWTSTTKRSTVELLVQERQRCCIVCSLNMMEIHASRQ